MTLHFEISAVDLAIAEAIVHHEHFYAFQGVGIGTRCVICSTAWATAEEWSRDSGVCPGYSQPCGMDPVGTQPLSIGPAA